jgi:hypothetical protein
MPKRHLKNYGQRVKNNFTGVCFKYNEPGHFAYACKVGVLNVRGDNAQGWIGQDLSSFVAPLCATQVPEQAFFCIPDRPSESNVRERINTVVVNVLKGMVTSKQIEDEFARIYPSSWRWTARKVADNTFTVKFPNNQLIDEWSCFNPISIRFVKAKINIAA